MQLFNTKMEIIKIQIMCCLTFVSYLIVIGLWGSTKFRKKITVDENIKKRNRVKLFVQRGGGRVEGLNSDSLCMYAWKIHCTATIFTLFSKGTGKSTKIALI